MSTVFQSAPAPAPLASPWIWAGRILSALMVLFLLFDGIIKFLKIQAVIDTFAQLGWPIKFAVPIGVIDVVCAVLYAIPRTAVLGAVLLTGLLGGAIATHTRIDSPLFSHTLFGVYMGLWAWGALYLREPRLRALLPFSR
jgi:DoxX-like protein